MTSALSTPLRTLMPRMPSLAAAFFVLMVFGVLPVAHALAATTTIAVFPSDVPDEEWPRGNVGDAPAGFEADSWQGPFVGKSNWHARYLADGDALSALFPADAATLTIADLASISYYTNRPTGTPAGRDWWIQIYTRPTGSGDCASWYKHRFINNYNDHTATDAWTQYSTDGGAMTFNGAGCAPTGEKDLATLIADSGGELIEMISIQTDSGWNGFDGYVDGLVITLTNGNVGRVNLETMSTTIQIAPWQVPDEELPRVNPADAPAGFGPDSWQGPTIGKSNWHARYLADGDKLSALFPAEAATLTIADLASISYFTKRPGATPAGRDWWIQIYTRPTGSGDCASWYKHRFINNYDDHTATGTWTQYSTDGAMTFNGAGCAPTGEKDLATLIADSGGELIEMISIQTDSGWNGFDGYVDGLEITLTNGKVGRVNLGSDCDGELPDLYVETSGADASNDCRTAGTPCATIQHAVDVSCSGDTVNVGAGTYDEQVSVPRPLTIQGAGKGVTIVAPTAVSANTTHLVSAAAAAAIILAEADGVNINDLTVDGAPAAFNACSPQYYGIFYRNASGTTDTVHVTNVTHPAAGGCQGVIGILIQSGGGGTSDVIVQDSMIDNYGKNGVTCNESGSTCLIKGSMVTGRGPLGLGEAAQNGIQIGSGAQGTIEDNEIRDNYYTPMSFCATGILLFEDGITVRGNLLVDNLCDLLALTNNSTLDENKIPAAREFPFSVLGSGNDVTGNLVNGSPYDGVYVDGINNTFTCNRVGNNGGAGFYFDSTASFGSTDGTPNTVNMNAITGNGVGVDGSVVLAPPNVDATDNWWGCVAGPGNAGCDTVTANVDVTPVATSVPACVSCASDAECDDGLACNGAETCNLGTSMCEAGTAVVCSDQCETGVCLEPAGTCELQPNGFVCSATPDTCTLDDTCQAGVCTDGGGGDGDADGVCDAEDNCPVDANPTQTDQDDDGQGDVCDLNETPESNINKVILKRESAAAKNNGGVSVKGDFIADPQSLFTTSAQITLRVDDAGSFSSTKTWDFATECQVNVKGRVKCKSADRRYKGTFKPYGKTPEVFKLRATFKKQDIDVSTLFGGPVTVTLTFGPTPPALGSIDRVGTIMDCQATGRGLKCRE